jgi:hypothetical protein
MDPNIPHQQITEYIRANATKYTREAIREQLIAAGHDPVQIDGVWELEMSSVREGAAGGGLAAVARAFFKVGAAIGALGAFAALGISPYTGSAPIFLVVYAVSYGAIGYGVVRLLRWAGPRFRIRGVWAGLVGLALLPIYGALMLGTCVGAYALGRGG